MLLIHQAMDLFDMSDGYSSLLEGVSRVKCPVMIIGIQTDILIPCWQQKEIADLLKESGNYMHRCIVSHKSNRETQFYVSSHL